MAALFQGLLGHQELPVAVLGLPELGFEVFNHLMGELPEGHPFPALLEPVPMAAQIGFHLSYEQKGIDGLGYESVAAGYQGGFPVAAHGLGRERDDEDPIHGRVLAELGGHLEP